MEDGAELVLQTFVDGSWVEMYGFIPEPVPFVDIEVNNWYTATHPTSPFVTGVFAGARRVDRCLSLFVNDEAVLVERAVGEPSSTTMVPPGQIPTLLAERFDLPGVSIGSGGQPQLAG
jgi:N-hydroxyarylamine O-acetyltransferase